MRSRRGAADLLLIASDGHGGTTAFFDGIAVIAAGAGVRVAIATSILFAPFYYYVGELH